MKNSQSGDYTRSKNEKQRGNEKMGIIVLLFEILYYALFMKVAKKGKSTIGYLLAFTIATAVNILLRSNELYTYILFIYISLILINYLTRDRQALSFYLERRKKDDTSITNNTRSANFKHR